MYSTCLIRNSGESFLQNYIAGIFGSEVLQSGFGVTCFILVLAKSRQIAHNFLSDFFENFSAHFRPYFFGVSGPHKNSSPLTPKIVGHFQIFEPTECSHRFSAYGNFWMTRRWFYCNSSIATGNDFCATVAVDGLFSVSCVFSPGFLEGALHGMLSSPPMCTPPQTAPRLGQLSS